MAEASKANITELLLAYSEGAWAELDEARIGTFPQRRLGKLRHVNIGEIPASESIGRSNKVKGLRFTGSYV